MAKIQDLTKYLDGNGIRYEIVAHQPAFSAHDVASTSHVSENVLAKTLIVRADDRYFMLVLPADHRMSDHLLRDLLGAHHVQLAKEDDLGQIFPDCEIGAMPPFGNLYALPVVIDKSLTTGDDLFFNACTHTEAMRMRMQDYMRLVRPFVGEFSQPRHTVEEW